MKTIESQPLSFAAASNLWSTVLAEIGVAIINTIRTMGLPTVRRRMPRGAVSEGTMQTPSPSAVRRDLLTDRDLHTDILERVEAEYWQAVARGAVAGDEDRPLIFCITQRVTWKLATRRARSLLRTVVPLDGQDPFASIASDAPLPDDLASDGQMLTRLRAVLASLPESDRQLLLAKAEGYDVLDAPGVPRATLRSRVHRLWKKVAESVTAQPRVA